MGKIEDSLMAKTKSENLEYIDTLREILEARRDDGDRTDYIAKNKSEAKKFSFFRYIKSKHTKTGRFGARQAEEKNDSILALDKDGEKTDKSYFDPFSLKIIIPKREDEAKKDAPQNEMDEDEDEDYDNPEENFEEKERNTQNELYEDFVSRVDEQIELAKENDFESERAGDASRMAVAQGISGDIQDMENKDKYYDAGQSFKSDIEVTEDVPDSFAVRLAVDHPPARYSQEFEQFNAKETKGMWAKIKGLFFKKPSEEEIFMKFAKTLPEYKQIEAIGKSEAAEAGMKYNPQEDPNMVSFLGVLRQDVHDEGTGHAGVKMIAKKKGRNLSEYSFGFVPVAKSGIAGAVTGLVQNPDKAGSASIAKETTISHSNYLRAAAKIRGIVGSMRTYSIIGYNCTSFAVDIAKTAGVDIKDEDSSSIIMTHRHHSQRVDSPYTLAKNLQKDYSTDARRYVARINESFNEKSDEEKANPTLVKNVTNEFLPTLMAFPLVTEMSKDNPDFKKEIEDAFKKKVLRIFAKGAEIDKAHSLYGLMGETLAEAQSARNEERIAAFGTATEQEYISGFMKNEDSALDALLGERMTYEKMKAVSFWSDDAGDALRDSRLKQLAESTFMIVYYPGADEGEKIKIAGQLLPEVWKKQKEIISGFEKELQDLKGAELVRKIIANSAGFGGAQMLGFSDMGKSPFNNVDGFKKFLDDNNIPMPQLEASKQAQTESVQKLNVPSMLSGSDMEEVVEMVENVSVGKFMDAFAERTGIEGYAGGIKKITYRDVIGFLKRAIKKKKIMPYIAVEYAKIKAATEKQEKEELFSGLLLAIANNLTLEELKDLIAFANIT